MTDIGVNTSGFNQNLILGKEIAKYGNTEADKQKALSAAKVHTGSEIVYQDKEQNWHVTELKEEGLFSSGPLPVGKALSAVMLDLGLTGDSSISDSDKDNMVIDENKLAKAGIYNSTVTYIEDEARFKDRMAIASDPKSSPELLKKLAGDDNGLVRQTVADNPNTSAETLKYGAKDSNFMVRTSVAENPHTPPETLKALSQDSNERVREAAIRTLNNPK
jgi:hypothetical protein